MRYIYSKNNYSHSIEKADFSLINEFFRHLEVDDQFKKFILYLKIFVSKIFIANKACYITIISIKSEICFNI
ncbi:hypothetical protein BpHYR1_008195 [Brachionus plicatilis]|uniref:Uncharacterized protein n=1 Tax=Brachionus plicatilis TaxID=10195 RepID=A0A3M7SS66_BRAPC|nr:hypothetical protein BpHYR1_008195 [Brachionus plicatilis]